MEQRHGIHTSRNSDQQVLPGPQQTMAADILRDLVEQSFLLQSTSASRSPKGRVKVASAGTTTSDLAALWTLLEMSPNGRLMTNTAPPRAVATKRLGE